MMPSLSLNNVSIYRDKKKLCQNIHVEFSPKQTWAILGRNGIGKTTLLHALSGLHQEYDGDILLNHISIKKISKKTLAKHIATLFQHYEDLFPANVIDTVFIGRYPYRKMFTSKNQHDFDIVHNALIHLDLIGFETKLISEISGGERRRVAIAQVMSQTPDIFLLDEPTHQLDLKYQSRVLQNFQQFTHTENKTVIMTSHDINLAYRFCDHVIMLFDDNTWLAGKNDDVYTQDNLEKLYQQKLICLETEIGKYWVTS